MWADRVGVFRFSGPGSSSAVGIPDSQKRGEVHLEVIHEQRVPKLIRLAKIALGETIWSGKRDASLDALIRQEG